MGNSQHSPTQQQPKYAQNPCWKNGQHVDPGQPHCQIALKEQQKPIYNIYFLRFDILRPYRREETFGILVSLFGNELLK